MTCAVPAALRLIACVAAVGALLGAGPARSEARLSVSGVTASPGGVATLQAGLQSDDPLAVVHWVLRLVPETPALPPLLPARASLAPGARASVMLDSGAAQGELRVRLQDAAGALGGLSVRIPVAVPAEALPGARYRLEPVVEYAAGPDGKSLAVSAGTGTLTVGPPAQAGGLSLPTVSATPDASAVAYVMAQDLPSRPSITLDVTATGTSGDLPRLSFEDPRPGTVALGEPAVVSEAVEGGIRVSLRSDAGIEGTGPLLELPVSVPPEAVPGSAYQLSVSVADPEGGGAALAGASGLLVVLPEAERAVSVVLSPLAASVPLGSSQTFAAVARDGDGRVLKGVTAAWTAEDGSGSVAVTPAGRVTGVAVGTARVRARVGSAVGEARVTVSPALAAGQMAAGTVEAAAGVSLDLPVHLSPIALLGADFTLSATAEGAPPLGLGTPVAEGTLSAGGLLEVNPRAPGLEQVGIITTEPVRGPGVLVRIPVTVPADAPQGTVYALGLSKVELVDGSAKAIPGVSPLPASLSVARDTEPPALALHGPEPGAWVRGRVNLVAEAEDGGGPVPRVDLHLDGSLVPAVTATASPSTLTLDTTALPEGPHLCVAKVVDAFGNAASAGPLLLVVDNTPPQMEPPGLPAGAALYEGEVFPIAASDSGGLVRVALLDGEGGPVLSSADRPPYLVGVPAGSGLPEGPRTLVVQAVDRAGNVTTLPLPVTLDTAPPKAAIVEPESGSVVRGRLAVRGAATDSAAPHAVAFRLALGPEAGPPLLEAAGSLATSAPGDGPAGTSLLADWDVSALPAGDYLLTLSVDEGPNRSSAVARVTVRPQVLRGDLTGDGTITIADVVRALSIALRIRAATPAETLAGDLDGDSLIAISDVIRVLRITLRLDPV